MTRILERGGGPLLASLLALTACGAPASEPRKATSPASAGTSKRAPTTAAATPPPPVPPLPRDVRKVETIARCDTELQVFPVGRAWFGICGGGFNKGSAFEIDAAAGVRELPGILDGLPANATLRVAGGPSIDLLEVAVDTPGIRGEIRYFMRRSGKRWVDMPSREIPEAFIGPLFASPWVLALDGYELGAVPWDGKLRVTDRSGRPRWVPKPQVGTGEDCPRRIPEYLGMARDADGAVWGMGKTCDDGLAAERFEPGKSDSTVETLLPAGTFSHKGTHDGGGILATREGIVAYANHAREETSAGGYAPKHAPVVVRREASGWKKLDTSSLGRTSIEEAVVAGSGQVLMRNGEQLLRLGADGVEAFLTGVESITVAPDRTAWIRGKRGVYRWIEGRVEQVGFEGDSPGDREIVDIHFDAAGHVMVVATAPGGESSVLLRETTRDATATAKPLELDGERAFTSPFSDFFPLERRTSRVVCRPALVLLYRLAKTAPADYDFPATRAALKGQRQFQDVRFAELDAVGERHFVAVVDDDIDLAFALARKVEAGVKGSKPLVFCSYALTAQLPIRRTLDIDLATGELRKPVAKP